MPAGKKYPQKGQARNKPGLHRGPLCVYNVVGKTYTIQFGQVEDGDDGSCNSRTQTIKVNSDLHFEQQQDTLLHEIYHAIDHEIHTKLTESQVRRHSTALLGLLRYNPELVEYLTRMTNGVPEESPED